MRITSFVALLSFVIVLCLLLVTTTANGAVIPPSEANNQMGERLFVQISIITTLCIDARVLIKAFTSWRIYRLYLIDILAESDYQFI